MKLNKDLKRKSHPSSSLYKQGSLRFLFKHKIKKIKNKKKKKEKKEVTLGYRCLVCD